MFRIGNGLCSFNHLGPSNHVTANNKVLHCVPLPKFARENILLQWMTEKIPIICGCECLSYLAHAKPMERQNSFYKIGICLLMYSLPRLPSNCEGLLGSLIGI